MDEVLVKDVKWITIGEKEATIRAWATEECEVEAKKIGERDYGAGESCTTAGRGCDYALEYLKVANADGDEMIIRLYAECYPEDVPGEGHYVTDEGQRIECHDMDFTGTSRRGEISYLDTTTKEWAWIDQDMIEWVYDDEWASEPFLEKALDELKADVLKKLNEGV